MSANAPKLPASSSGYWDPSVSFSLLFSFSNRLFLPKYLGSSLTMLRFTSSCNWEWCGFLILWSSRYIRGWSSSTRLFRVTCSGSGNLTKAWCWSSSRFRELLRLSWLNLDELRARFLVFISSLPTIWWLFRLVRRWFSFSSSGTRNEISSCDARKASRFASLLETRGIVSRLSR